MNNESDDSGLFTGRAALFFDRDGTLIVDAHFLADPSRVELLPDAARAVQRANDAGMPVVIVTNQSGIARGLITPKQYMEVCARVERLLAAEGAHVLATYHCPDSPDTPPESGCRKPGLALFRQAAREHNLDLANSGFIGDRWRDVQPAVTSGGVGVLVPNAETPPDDVEAARSSADPRIFMAERLLEAVTIVLASIAHVNNDDKLL